MEQIYLDTARRAARAGAEVLKQLWGRQPKVKQKKRFDFVTEADLASQEAVLAVINQAHPDHAILAEETPADLAQAASLEGPLWVVDPLDGTTNFIHGLPHVAVSVALLIKGQPRVGVVLDIMRGEEFWAHAGRGAWMNGEPMAVAEMEGRDHALLFTGFPFRDKHLLKPYLKLFEELFTQCAGVRRAGTAALDLAWLAAGRGQGFWELGLMPGRGGQRFSRRRRRSVVRRHRGGGAQISCLAAGGLRQAFSSWRRELAASCRPRYPPNLGRRGPTHLFYCLCGFFGKCKVRR